MLRTLLVAVAGAVGGVVAATLLSAFAPVGEARLADPDPGLAFDWPVAGLGAVAAVAVVLALGVPSRAARCSDARLSAAGPRGPSPGSGPGNWPARPRPAPAAVTVDIDAAIVTSCSEKEQAMPTWKKTYGDHPLTVFADHGPEGSGEPLAVMLRAGNAGSNTAADHIEATRLALAQLPRPLRRRVLIRTDSGGGTHDFLKWMTRPGRKLAYPVGFTITEDIAGAILKIPASAWTPAYDAEGLVRPGAWVAEMTGMTDLSSWPKGMRLIVRKERPHPGAQLRFTGIDGHRFTCFATDTKGGQLADLELRHRRRARCEDRIRGAKDTGLRNRPLQGFTQNQIWCEIVALACELTAWMQMLALDGPARRWEPKRLRLRIFTCAGRLVRGGRRLKLRIAASWPWASHITTAITRLQALTPG